MLQSFRRRLDGRSVRAQEERQILELRLDALSHLQVRGELRIERRQLAQASPKAFETRQHGLVALVQLDVALRAEPLQPLCVRQDLTRGSQLPVLIGLRRGALELAKLKREELDARGLLPLTGSHALELAANRSPPFEGKRHGGALGAQPSVLVQHIDVAPRVQQGLVLMLSVQVDEAASELFQRVRGHQLVVDERAAPPLRRDLPPHQDFLSLRRFDTGLDHRSGLTGSHEIGRGPITHEEPERLDNDGLARPSLAGQDIETGLEL